MRGLLRRLGALAGTGSGAGSGTGSGAGSGRAADALRAAIVDGTAAALNSWAGTGVAGVRALHDELTGRSRVDTTGAHPREAIDNLAAAVAAIASAHPAAFLDVFADPALDGDTFVVTGLGYVDDPVATERLVDASRSGDQWVRMAAAIALGRHHAPGAVPALTELIGDPEYLVRYHALKGLAAVGDARAIPVLEAFAAPIPVERDLADAALEAIAKRGAGGSPGEPVR